ncbi:hypothetical protein W97_09356 [Coniosporium apollinis CBS 100218]|uniref:UBX domain-containing protein n=1 Tax=Coniosporium apollinis (strain CBS 100218) TaxID=1168221 RepID=R7Z7F5_CONA1|nr:uncharacterized protein W97_09356 [Coniosporium apollinis CBS 100218]EON70090.1 hypothetical protein W97_09356 [Coniosporium apollinis CBS 100218]
MAEPTGADRDAVISQFCDITGTTPARAEAVLSTAEWDVETAISLFYSMADDERPYEEPIPGPEADLSRPVPDPSRGRTLAGGSGPSASSSSASQPSAARNKPQGGLRTLKDLQNDAGGHGHAHNDDDDDDDNDQDFFTGGEKSGLAVHNPKTPKEHMDRIVKKAREQMDNPSPESDDEAPVSRFRGAGQTLGGDDTPSHLIPDPEADRPRFRERAHRTLNLWRDGFSVDDGPLYRFDDPANAEALAMIHQGRAPLSLLNVEEGQPVELIVHPHTDQDYVPPKRKYKPFSGSGQRLGSPVPGASSSAASGSGSRTAPAAPTSAGPAAPPSVNVNDSQPVVTLQIRLGDGTQLRSRFNTSHTVGDVYRFVDAASPASMQRAYDLMTTFPNKVLGDRGAVLADVPELKRGGVVVQKWQ